MASRAVLHALMVEQRFQKRELRRARCIVFWSGNGIVSGLKENASRYTVRPGTLGSTLLQIRRIL
jgi:hypothetical protein